MVADSNSFAPPEGARSAAKRALEWIKEGHAGSGFTAVGLARARDLANGRKLSLDTVKRMHSYFSRHAPDQKAEGFSQGEKGFPSPGRVAWDAWGGDAGKSWASKVVKANTVENAKIDPQKWEMSMRVLLEAAAQKAEEELAGKYSTDERMKMADKGLALPDGSYPIANIDDLKNAIQAFGRSKDKTAARNHIMKRARALGAESLIPSQWLKG